MRAVNHHPLARADAVAATSLPLTIVKLSWRYLPLLVVMDALVTVAAIPVAALLFAGGFVVAPLLAALTVGAVWAGVVATTDRLVRDEEVSLQLLLRNIAEHALTGISVSLAPALIVSTGIGTLFAFAEAPDRTWLLPSLFVDGCALTLSLLAQPSLFSLATGPRLRGLALWKSTLSLIACHPMTIVPLPLIAVLSWLAVSLSGGPGLLFFTPALLALSGSAVTAAAIGALPGRAADVIADRRQRPGPGQVEGA